MHVRCHIIDAWMGLWGCLCLLFLGHLFFRIEEFFLLFNFRTRLLSLAAKLKIWGIKTYNLSQTGLRLFLGMQMKISFKYDHDFLYSRSAKDYGKFPEATGNLIFFLGWRIFLNFLGIFFCIFFFYFLAERPRFCGLIQEFLNYSSKSTKILTFKDTT
jgi:hypothetical protein